MNLNTYWLVVKFNFLHLRGRISVLSIADSISTEIIIAGAHTKVSAVGLEFLAIAVFLCQGLVNIVPDKTTLEKGFFFHKVCIFVHGTTGISHSVGIFAKNVGLILMFFQIIPNFRCRCIHGAYHVCGLRISGIPPNTFIMNQPGIIPFVEGLAHFQNILAAIRFITTGPNDNRGMILISLKHTSCPV